MDYGKLVRGKIPEIIEENGEEPIVRVLDDEEYVEALNLKLEEEVGEYLESGDVEELADVLEVIYALLEVEDMDMVYLEKIRKEKREERGGFEERIYLEDVE
jgi:predicted house-cleaning noncanonical NTP pyrophosphatase (MazG superfamily)